MMTREQILQIARNEHYHFTKLLDSNSKNVNKRECHHYQRLYAGIIGIIHHNDKATWEDLAPFERAELMMALESI